jgi:hypothetical protein
MSEEENRKRKEAAAKKISNLLSADCLLPALAPNAADFPAFAAPCSVDRVLGIAAHAHALEKSRLSFFELSHNAANI